MLKKSLAWVLTLALLLSTLSGLALVSSAATGASFAYVSYVSGTPMYKNASMHLDKVTAAGNSTAMASITGNADDRYAHYMQYQNDELGINVPADLGIGANATIEIVFWPKEDKGEVDPGNQASTRLGVRYSNANGLTGYGDLRMHGAAATGELETMTINAANLPGLSSAEVLTDASGWKTLKIAVTDADFSASGAVDIVKWSHDNSATTDGWYIKSILVYDTAKGAPDAEDLFIREDTVGFVDFAGEEEDKELLTYTAEGSSVEDLGDTKALKLGAGHALIVTADDVEQPAVLPTEAAVTVMAKARVGEGDWQVYRKDITNNNGQTFDLGALLFDGLTGDIYVEKFVVCRTAMVTQYTSEGAFVKLDEPYALHPDFPDVLDTSWRMSWDFEDEGQYTHEVKGDDGMNAIYATGGYVRFNVDDNFTKNNGANIADLGISITYFDKGTGMLKIQYNKQVPAGEEDSNAYKFAAMDVVALTNTETWKTVTVYLSDAQFRNLANGNDFRIPMGELGAGAAISAVVISIGADKAELNELIAKPINTARFTEESLALYNAELAKVQQVQGNVYATAAQVADAVATLEAAFAALVEKTGEVRYSLTGALWDITKSDGEIVLKDGWYCWQFPATVDGKWIGIGDEFGVLKDATSVTYEYEVLFSEDSAGNARAFLCHGTKDGWFEVREGAYPTGNGYMVNGAWNKTPSAGRWGTITLQNDNFDSTVLQENCITRLGNWTAGGGTLYVRSIKAYDTNAPENFVLLQFNEDTVDAVVEPGSSDVELTEKDGFESYKIPGEGSLNIDVSKLIEAGVVSADDQYVVVDFEYYLEDCSNANELLMVKHYNTEGTGQNADKTDACEHQLTSAELTTRNDWVRAHILLDDANLGADPKTLNITYSNGSNVYIRGVKVYAADAEGEMTSERPAKWGTVILPEVVDAANPFYDWDADESYGMSVSFSEGTTATTFPLIDGRVCAMITDDMLYVNVDEEEINGDNNYIRIDITHQMGSIFYVRYNKVVPEGVDISVEPNLTQYNFHASGENEIVAEDGTNVWMTTEDDFVNTLGVVMPTADHFDWTTSSIYLNDAQFRNAANGWDFRIHTVGMAFVSRVDVCIIDEAEYNAVAETVGDLSELKATYNAAVEQYAENMPEKIAEALTEAENFMYYNYRADQATIDEALAKLNAALNGTLGDVNGDGKVNTSDARYILQFAAEKIGEADLDMSMADTDGNGKVNTTDARYILQLAAEKIDKLPAEA